LVIHLNAWNGPVKMAAILAVMGVLVSVPALGASGLVLVDEDTISLTGGMDAASLLLGNGMSSPRDLKVQSHDNSAILTWTAPKDLNGIVLEGYVIQRSIDGGLWGNVTMVDAKTTRFTDEWISNGMVVVYRVVAVGGDGWSAPSNEATARPIGMPWPPTNVRTEVMGPSVMVGWSEPRYDGGSAITSYVIFRKADADREFKRVAEVSSDDMSWFDRTASGNASVKYYVVARNAAGPSDPSEAAFAEDVPSLDGYSAASSGTALIALIASGIALMAVVSIALMWAVRSRRRAEIERRMRFCQSVQYNDPNCQGAAFFTPTARHL
jgi:hypothetical protein